MIGIFDSGLGGLTAYRELRRLKPNSDIVYFGDTGRVPYGNRSRETLIKYATQDMNFLMSKHVDIVLVACGTVSSTAIEYLREKFAGIPIIGVVDSAAKAAAALTENKKVAVIATAATVKSGAFERNLQAIDPTLEVISTACPLFVPLVENGFIDPDDEIPRLVAERYLAGIRESGADTLILGCTHYPIIEEIIQRVLPGVKLVSSSKAAAEELAALYRDSSDKAAKTGIGSGEYGANEFGINENNIETGKTEFFVSDEPVNFEALASTFLDEPIEHIAKRISIENY